MSSDALENAKAKREAVARERNRAVALADELKKQLDRIDQFIADYEVFSAGDVPSAETVWPMMFDAAAAPPIPMRPHKNSKKEDVATATRYLIQEAGQPIPRSNLLTLLINKGLVIGGGAPDTVLSTMLWRTKDTHGVIHLRNVGYWLKEVPWAPAHYDPNLDGIMGVEDDAPADDGSGADDE